MNKILVFTIIVLVAACAKEESIKPAKYTTDCDAEMDRDVVFYAALKVTATKLYYYNLPNKGNVEFYDHDYWKTLDAIRAIQNMKTPESDSVFYRYDVISNFYDPSKDLRELYVTLDANSWADSLVKGLQPKGRANVAEFFRVYRLTPRSYSIRTKASGQGQEYVATFVSCRALNPTAMKMQLDMLNCFTSVNHPLFNYGNGLVQVFDNGNNSVIAQFGILNKELGQWHLWRFEIDKDGKPAFTPVLSAVPPPPLR